MEQCLLPNDDVLKLLNVAMFLPSSNIRQFKETILFDLAMKLF